LKFFVEDLTRSTRKNMLHTLATFVDSLIKTQNVSKKSLKIVIFCHRRYLK